MGHQTEPLNTGFGDKPWEPVGVKPLAAGRNLRRVPVAVEFLPDPGQVAGLDRAENKGP
jgi:hypothetical protein